MTVSFTNAYITNTPTHIHLDGFTCLAHITTIGAYFIARFQETPSIIRNSGKLYANCAMKRRFHK